MATVEIDSYERYHIGSKLNPGTNFENLRDQLKFNVTNVGFTPIDEKVSGSAIHPPVEIIATKNNVKLELNYALQALNVIGTSPSEVTSSFEEIMSILINLEYDIDRTFVFNEVVATIILKSHDKPFDVIGEAIGLKSDLFIDANIPNINTVGIRIGGNEPTDKTFLNIIIEPNPTNPNLKTSVKVHYRGDKTYILNFYESLNEKIKNLFDF